MTNILVLVLQCMWCDSNKMCLPYHGGLPSSECGLKDLRLGTCWGELSILLEYH